DREREDQQRRFRVAVPTDEVGGDHERPCGESVQPEDRRGGDRLQEDPRMVTPFAELAAGPVGGPVRGGLCGCTHDKPPNKVLRSRMDDTPLTRATMSHRPIRLPCDTWSVGVSFQ